VIVRPVALELRLGLLAGLLAIGLAGQAAAEPAEATGIAAGDTHACARTAQGGAVCWGANVHGQLGDGSDVDRSLPVPVVGLSSGVAQLASGGAHSCALTSGGGVVCWGWNIVGQLGNDSPFDSHVPVPVSGLSSGVAQVASGYAFSCAVTSSGGVYCWGNNHRGQLGDGSLTNRDVPVPVVGLASGVASVAAGSDHSCALLLDGSVQCWGGNATGQLGDGTSDDHTTPAPVPGLSSVAAIEAGSMRSCAVTTAGDALCWGNNTRGQLGDGTTSDRWEPVPVVGLPSEVEQITTDLTHTCAVGASGSAWCWGSNDNGQLGDGTTSERWEPVPVAGLPSEVEEITAGSSYTCAIDVSGSAWCWGARALGNGTAEWRTERRSVYGLSSGVVSIALGFRHTCALRSDGAVLCWGTNSSGQLGRGSTGPSSSLPLVVTALSSGVESVAAHWNHSCAIGSGGAAWCWGSNDGGQLGDGTISNRPAPVAVTGLSSGVVAIAPGFSHTCALTSGGGVVCWGSNSNGQLGDGTVTDHAVPAPVSGLSSGVVSIASGSYHSCALTGAGGVLCWGYNSDGQIGDGSGVTQRTPVAVSGLETGVTAIEAGSLHSCALTNAGEVRCWGGNASGQLGDGTHTARFTPVAASGLSDVVALAAGALHSCALTGGGAGACWGRNNAGQLGDGNANTHSTSAVAVQGLANAGAIDGGYEHSCALVGSGAECWGANFEGQLGDGFTTVNPEPVAVVPEPGALSGIATGLAALGLLARRRAQGRGV
jgi:alpha-tubulin suppressor-like RCC1 family protein